MSRSNLVKVLSCVFVVGMLTSTAQAQILIDENFELFPGGTFPLSDVSGFVETGAQLDIRTGFGGPPNGICVGANCVLPSGGGSSPMKTGYNNTGATSFAEARLSMSFSGATSSNGRAQLALLPDGTTAIPTTNSGTWADVLPNQGTGGPSGLGAPNSVVVELYNAAPRDLFFYAFDASGNQLGSTLTSTTDLGNDDYIDVRMRPATGGVSGEFRFTGGSGGGPIGAWIPIGGGSGVLAVAPGWSPATYGVGAQTQGTFDNMFFLIPEPSSAALLASGLALTLMIRRRRSV